MNFQEIYDSESLLRTNQEREVNKISYSLVS
jgi:hypothetical protein